MAKGIPTENSSREEKSISSQPDHSLNAEAGFSGSGNLPSGAISALHEFRQRLQETVYHYIYQLFAAVYCA
jgi:hypothetical protein